MNQEAPWAVNTSDDVDIGNRIAEDASVRSVVGDGTKRVAPEGVNIQWQMIVEGPVPGAQHSALIRERGPAKTGAGRDAQTARQPLMLNPGAIVERDPRGHRPMILGVSGDFKIGAAERILILEVDALLQNTCAILDVDGTEGKVALVAQTGNRAAHLEKVRSRQMEGGQRPCLQPFRAAGAADLGTEKIALIPLRRHDHVGAALGANGHVESLQRHAAIDQTVQKTEAVEQCAGVVLLRVAGRYRLRIEEIGVDEVYVLRAEVKRRGENLLIGKNVIELRKGIDRLLFGYVVRKRQCAVGSFIEYVLKRIDEVHPIANQRSAQNKAWRFIPDAGQTAAAGANVGERIFEVDVPLFAAAARFHRDHALGEAAILREKRSVENVHGFNGVDGDALPEVAGGGIGDVALIDYHGAAFLAGAFNLHLAVGSPHDARLERQDVVDRGGVGRQGRHVERTNQVVFRGALLHRHLCLGDIDRGGLHLGCQHQGDLQIRGARNLDRSYRTLEAFLGSGDGPGSARNSGEVREPGCPGVVAPERLITESHAHIRFEDGAFLRVEDEDAKLTGPTGLSRKARAA